MLVGQGNLDKILPIPPEQVTEPVVPEEVDAGCYEQRLVYASIKNEVEGPESAREYLQSLDERVEQLQAEELEEGVPEEERFELTEDQRELRNAMGELLTEYEAGNFSDSGVPEDSKELIKERLGFPGELFLVPEGTDQQATRDNLIGGVATSVSVMMVFGLFAILAGVVGVGCCVAFPVMTFCRSWHVDPASCVFWITFMFGVSIATWSHFSPAALRHRLDDRPSCG